MASLLAQDLRGKSFRGKNCEHWDFSGTDLRGCDFRKARLYGANFSGVVTGQSRKKVCLYLLILGVFTIVGITGRMITYNNGKVGTNEFSSFSMILFLSLFLLPYSPLIEMSVLGLVEGAWIAATIYMIWQIDLWDAPILYTILQVLIAGLMLFMALQVALIIQRIFQNVTGTDFRGANLQGLNFENATLHNLNFDNANRKYLNNDESQRANLSDANLSRSTLQDLDLSFTNLTSVNVRGTHFKRTILTGACIRDWTMDNETQFDRVVCKYIYLSPNRTPADRLPTSGNFKPGEFEAFIRKQS